MSAANRNKKSRAETNRENAKKSTGPKTEEGKRRSSLNGIRHGLTGQVVVLPIEDLAEFQRFGNTFWNDYQPQGALESQLVQMVSDLAWRINRASAVEKVRVSLTIDDERESVDTECAPAHNAFVEARNYEKNSDTIKNISLYEARLASRFDKAVKQLAEVQAVRRALEAEEMEKAAVLFEMEEEAASAAPGRPFIYTPADDGFGFSVVQVKLHIRLRDRLIVARRCEKMRATAARC